MASVKMKNSMRSTFERDVGATEEDEVIFQEKELRKSILAKLKMCNQKQSALVMSGSREILETQIPRAASPKP